jgi:hypothetical protein
MTNDQPDQSVHHRLLHQVSFGLTEAPNALTIVSISDGLAAFRLVKAEIKDNGEVTLVGGKHALISAVLFLSDPPQSFVSYATRRAVADILLVRD